MKTISKLFIPTILSFFLLVSECDSQNYSFPTNENGEYEFSEVVTCSLSKQALYTNAKAWVTDMFKNPKAAIQLESEASGKIVVNGNYDKFTIKSVEDDYSGFEYERVYFTITIDCKDNKYRYRINNIDLKSVNYSTYSHRDYETSIKHEDHLTKINWAKQDKAEIARKMEVAKETLKGRKYEKEMEVLNKKLKEAEEKIIYENRIYFEEYNYFKSLGYSIKKGMAVNDDF